MTLIFVVVVVLSIVTRLCNCQCDVAIATPADRRVNKAKLKIVNYNTEWLYTYDVDGAGTECHEWNKLVTTYSDPTSQFPVWDRVSNTDPLDKLKQESDEHLKKIAGYLDILDADIFVFEEICDCATLEKVRKKLAHSQLYRSYYIRNDIKMQQLGIITKIDPEIEARGVFGYIASFVKNNGKPNFELLHDGTNGRPKGFRTEFAIGRQGKLVLYAVHLTAGRIAAAMRVASAQSIKTKVLVDIAKANTYVLLTGDMNVDPSWKDEEKADKALNAGWVANYLAKKRLNTWEPVDGGGHFTHLDIDVGGKIYAIKGIQYQVVTEQTIKAETPKTINEMDALINEGEQEMGTVDPIKEIRIHCGTKMIILKKGFPKWDITKPMIHTMEFVNAGTSVKVSYPPNAKGKCVADSIIGPIEFIKKVVASHAKKPSTLGELDALVGILSALPAHALQKSILKLSHYELEPTLDTFTSGTAFTQLNLDNGQTGEEKYSHRACADPLSSDPYSIFDYFFASANLKAVIDGTMEYVHDGGRRGDHPANEKVCNGYSDHAPIKVVFKTEGTVLGADPSGHWFYDFDRTLIVILAVVVICTFMVPPFVCGVFCGRLARNVKQGQDIFNL